MLRLSLAATAISLLTATAAVSQAQERAPGAADPGAQGLSACRADMQMLCAGVPAAGGQRLQCLVQNRDKVSPACAEVMAAVEARGARRPPGPASGMSEGVRPGLACRADLQMLCGSAGRGPERAQCLRENVDRLSPECREAIAQAASMRREARAACRGDAESLCSGDERGRGGVMGCLRQNADRLSRTCADMLAQLPGGRRNAR